MRAPTRSCARRSLLLLLVALSASVSVIRANPAGRAEITPPTPTAGETETVPTTERITTTAAAAASPAITTTMETTPDPAPTSTSTSTTAPADPTPPATQEAQEAANKEPSQGLVSFDQRQHGRFNIRADLDNFMIILLPQSTTKSPLLNLGGFGSSSGGLGGGGGLGLVPGSSLLDLFTRKLPSKRKGSSYRRKYKVKSASYKRRYKEMLKKQAQAEEEEERAAAAADEAEEKAAAKEALAEPETVPSAEAAVKVHEEPPRKLEVDAASKEELDGRANFGDNSGVHDKYRMDTLEKIQHQLDILIKRVDARDGAPKFERPSKANMEHFVEGRTPYRVDIGSLSSEADVLPSAQGPVPFRQFRTDRPLEIGNHVPQPKFFQPWAFAPAPAENAMNPFAARGPVMVAFRDGRSLAPRPEGNELRTNSILALPLDSLGFARAMEMEANEASPSHSSAPSASPSPPQSSPTDTLNPYLDAGFVDLTDTIHSFDSLNVDNVDTIETPTQTAQFNKDWDLKLLGASDDCGPDRRRDSYGICQFVQF